MEIWHDSCIELGRTEGFIMINRRNFLTGMTAAGLAATVTPVNAAGITTSGGRLNPGSPDDQGPVLQALLDKAAKQNTVLVLDPGRYRVSNITLPKNTRILGVSGSTVLEYAGGDHFIYGENGSYTELSGIVFDGALQPVKEYADAAVRINGTSQLKMSDCRITNAGQIGVQIDKSAGTFERNRIDNAVGDAGFFGLENTGLMIFNNLVEQCANNGILVYRWDRGEDNTIVSQNRVQYINAINGGTGPYGNGINTYQADGVVVTNNHVSDCAFSAVRSNSCSNIQITNNTCLRSGEAAVYSEFAFQGANISGNIIDGGVRGISIANLDKGGRLSVCANNLIRNIHDRVPYEEKHHFFGTGISAEAECAITGNVIENSINFGIFLGWGNYLRNVAASNNVIRRTKTGFYVSVVEGTGKVNITNNVMSQISRAGIVGYHWKDAVTGDLARDGGGKFGNLTIDGNRISS